jgi:hypothetical protein
LILKAFPLQEDQYYSERGNFFAFLLLWSFYHWAAVKQDYYMTHFFELNKILFSDAAVLGSTFVFFEIYFLWISPFTAAAFPDPDSPVDILPLAIQILVNMVSLFRTKYIAKIYTFFTSCFGEKIPVKKSFKL